MGPNAYGIVAGCKTPVACRCEFGHHHSYPVLWGLFKQFVKSRDNVEKIGY